MAYQLEGKKVPWAHFEQYLDLHQRKIVSLQTLLAEETCDKPAIERMSPKPFSIIHEFLTKMLRDNGIFSNQRPSDND